MAGARAGRRPRAGPRCRRAGARAGPSRRPACSAGRPRAGRRSPGPGWTRSPWPRCDSGSSGRDLRSGRPPSWAVRAGSRLCRAASAAAVSGCVRQHGVPGAALVRGGHGGDGQADDRLGTGQRHRAGRGGHEEGSGRPASGSRPLAGPSCDSRSEDHERRAPARARSARTVRPRELERSRRAHRGERAVSPRRRRRGRRSARARSPRRPRARAPRCRRGARRAVTASRTCAVASHPSRPGSMPSMATDPRARRRVPSRGARPTGRQGARVSAR